MKLIELPKNPSVLLIPETDGELKTLFAATDSKKLKGMMRVNSNGWQCLTTVDDLSNYHAITGVRLVE